MFNIFSQKAFNEIIPFHRALMTINNKGNVITIPIKKIVGVGFGVGDIISLDDWQFVSAGKVEYINKELIGEEEFKMDYDKFLELCKSKIFSENILLLKVVRKQYHNNLLIIVADVFSEYVESVNVERNLDEYKPDVKEIQIEK